MTCIQCGAWACKQNKKNYCNAAIIEVDFIKCIHHIEVECQN